MHGSCVVPAAVYEFGMITPGKHGIDFLVVDDETIVSDTIKMLLVHDGHEAQAVETGEAALARMEQRRFDVVITDFHMPGMKGDQLVARIKELYPGQPVIMITAFAEEYNQKVFGQPSGRADVLLLKPFSLAELREAINRVFPRKNPNPSGGESFASNPPHANNSVPNPKP